ncbi:hypothetical protein QL285_035045 [Trifolium repens]|nr:hypothetical protein QL285_035045 [Trifolium repens]
MMADRNHDSNSTIHPNFSSAISDFLQEGSRSFPFNSGKRTGYCRGLGVGIKPTSGKSTALNQELASECKKRHDIELKLKEVEAQLQEERHKREENASQFEETQRQLEERMEKQLEVKLAHIFFRMNPFTVGQFSGAMNIAACHDHRVENTSNIFAQRETMDASTTLQREGQDKPPSFSMMPENSGPESHPRNRQGACSDAN